MKSKDGSNRTRKLFAVTVMLLASSNAWGQFQVVSQRQAHAPITWAQPVPGSSLLDWDTLDRLHSPILQRDRKILGAQSCAAASCHGGPRPGVSQVGVRRGGEYLLWLENDPHAESWRTLCSPASVTMMRRLKIIDRSGNVLNQSGFDNCLACHNSTQRFREPRRQGGHLSVIQVHENSPRDECECNTEACVSVPPTYDLAETSQFSREGVGCSACHGPSEHWIGAHTQFDFSGLSSTQVGFVANGDLYTRARVCASCHVGDKDRDMNHDIIAAGHPVLRYELTTYHNRLPKHWRDSAADDLSFYEAQLWLAGQIAATDASLSLLESRASKSLSVSVWPEFASYDCASCHHHLGFEKQPSERVADAKSTARLSRWNDAGLRWLVEKRIRENQATAEDLELLNALDQVRQWMESKPQPNPDEAARLAQAARHALARWFDSVAGGSERSLMGGQRLAEVVTFAAGKTETFSTIESASQYYLAAIASRSSWRFNEAGPVKDAASRLRNGLRDPRGIRRSRVRELGIEMAGWLGPLQLESVPDDSPVWDEETDAGSSERLDSILDEIDRRWKTRDKEIAEEVEKWRRQRQSDSPATDRPKLQSDELQKERAKNSEEASKAFESDSNKSNVQGDAKESE